MPRILDLSRSAHGANVNCFCSFPSCTLRPFYIIDGMRLSRLCEIGFPLSHFVIPSARLSDERHERERNRTLKIYSVLGSNFILTVTSDCGLIFCATDYLFINKHIPSQTSSYHPSQKSFHLGNIQPTRELHVSMK